MEYFKDEKPIFLLTERECKQLNMPVSEGEFPVGKFSSSYKDYREFLLYNRKESVEHLPIFKNEKEIPIGFITKSQAYHFKLDISPEERPAGMIVDKYGRGFIGIYDKRNNPGFIQYKEHISIMKSVEEDDSLPPYNHKTKPKNWRSLHEISKYYLDPMKEPCGIYISNKERYWYLYDMTDELAKSHYTYCDVPKGFLTFHEFERFGFTFDEKEVPAAYLAFTGKSVLPLYDRSKHPKWRLRILTGNKI